MLHATIKKSLETLNLDSTQVNTQDDTQVKILEFCKIPRSKNEITAFLGYKDAKSIAKNHLNPLIMAGKLTMTIPNKPNSKNQKYVVKQ